MISFYGGRPGKDFRLAKTFSNKTEMDSDLAGLYLASPVQMNDFVLINYFQGENAEEQTNYQNNFRIDNELPDPLTLEQIETTPNGVLPTNPTKSYHGTFWQKVLKNNELTYVLISDFKIPNPDFSIEKKVIEEGPEVSPSVKQLQNEEWLNGYKWAYQLHMPRPPKIFFEKYKGDSTPQKELGTEALAGDYLIIYPNGTIYKAVSSPSLEGSLETFKLTWEKLQGVSLTQRFEFNDKKHDSISAEGNTKNIVNFEPIKLTKVNSDLIEKNPELKEWDFSVSKPIKLTTKLESVDQSSGEAKWDIKSSTDQDQQEATLSLSVPRAQKFFYGESAPESKLPGDFFIQDSTGVISQYDENSSNWIKTGMRIKGPPGDSLKICGHVDVTKVEANFGDLSSALSNKFKNPLPGSEGNIYLANILEGVNAGQYQCFYEHGIWYMSRTSSVYWEDIAVNKERAIPMSQLNKKDLELFRIDVDSIAFGDYPYAGSKTLIEFSNNQNLKYLQEGNNITIYPLKGVGILAPENSSRLFERNFASNLYFRGLRTNITNNMSYMFYKSQTILLDLNNFNTSNVTDMSHMFDSSKATTIVLNSFNTNKVTTMESMFDHSRAEILDLSSFDTSNVTNMKGMFNYSKAISLDLSSFDTSNVSDMSWMFVACNEIMPLNFNTSNVINMQNMFEGYLGTTLDLSSFNTNKVTIMSHMFQGSKLNILNLKNKFNTTNVTRMNGMFQGIQTEILDLTNFNINKVEQMLDMFAYSNIQTLDLSSFDFSNKSNIDMTNMFNNAKITRILCRSEQDKEKLINSPGNTLKPNCFEVK